MAKANVMGAVAVVDSLEWLYPLCSTKHCALWIAQALIRTNSFAESLRRASSLLLWHLPLSVPSV